MGNAGSVSMTFKRSLILSLGLGIAGGLAAYALAWGLFTTHPELGMESKNALVIAAWTAPLAFLGSLIYFAVRSAERR
jgi:lipopolysaccharide export LptBFGC system permease protein LptF